MALRCSKWPGGGLQFQLNGIIIVSPGGSFLLQSINSITGSKHFASVSLWIMGMLPFSFLHLNSWTWVFWLPEIWCHTLNIDSEHAWLSGEPCSSPIRYCYLADMEPKFSKTILVFHQASCFNIMGNIVRTVDSMNMDRLTHFWFLLWSEIFDQKKQGMECRDAGKSILQVHKS